MCGIAGFVGETPHPRAVLGNMLVRIRHRGPDGSGDFFDAAAHAALGHRRLAILDLDGGAQPMFTADRRLVVVFNGELYNYRELTAELQAAGHHFATRSDTEVLLHGYEQWGDELPCHLRGMFAFVLWDTVKKTMFAARDFFGIKPFYYCQSGGVLLFASEIKCFLAHPAFVKTLNPAQLAHYLSCQYSPGAATFFAGVYKLPPAHWLKFEGGRLTTGRWGEPRFVPQYGLSLPQWQRQIDGALRDSVAAHCLADVEVGCFLSGGVDSSLLATLANVPHTFTVGFANAHYDETADARALAKQLGLQNTTAQITPQEFWAVLPDIQYHMDEPLADASAAALYFLNREAAKRVKVCLSGEGADELFGGYNIYREPFTARWYDALPGGLRRGLGAVANRLPPLPGVNFIERRAAPLDARYLGPTNLMNEPRKNSLLRPAYRQGPTTALTAPEFAATAGQDAVTRMQSCDTVHWLVGDILLKADKMSMAHSLEVRVPFLDSTVFEVARRLPPAYKADAEQTKIALRAAAATALPPARAAAKKRGFPVPVRDWLRQPAYVAQVEKLFAGEAAAQFFYPDALHTLLDRHVLGRCDNWRQIWCVTSFLVWYSRFFGEGA